MSQLSPVDNFIEQMGVITQTDGGPRIAGRIFGLLLAEGRPFGLNEMAERLQISKASASTNARLLLGSGMLHLTARAGDRQDYYELGADPYGRMIDTISVRMREASIRVREAEVLFPDPQDPARQRVRKLAAFYASSADFFNQWAEHLHQDANASEFDPQDKNSARP